MHQCFFIRTHQWGISIQSFSALVLCQIDVGDRSSQCTSDRNLSFHAQQFGASRIRDNPCAHPQTGAVQNVIFFSSGLE
jgi:hypothetical protein